MQEKSLAKRLLHMRNDIDKRLNGFSSGHLIAVNYEIWNIIDSYMFDQQIAYGDIDDSFIVLSEQTKEHKVVAVVYFDPDEKLVRCMPLIDHTPMIPE